MPQPNHRTIPSQSLNTPKPAKKAKKVAVKLPSRDGRRVLDTDNATDTGTATSTPPVISTIPTSTSHLHQSPDDNVIDIFLPGKDAWDAIKQRGITNQLYKLGIHTQPTLSEQKYDSNFDTPPENDLLSFKMDRFFNDSLVDSKTPNPDNSTLSLSNFNTTSLSPALSSPSGYLQHSPLSNTGYLSIPHTSAPASNASPNPSSLADVEEVEEVEEVENAAENLAYNTEAVDNTVSTDNTQQQDNKDQLEVENHLNNTSPNTSIIPDEAPQLPPPSFQELSRGFGYELDYEDEQAQLAQLEKEERNHKKSMSGFSIKSDSQQYDNDEDVQDVVDEKDDGATEDTATAQDTDAEAVEDIFKAESLDDNNTNTDIDEQAFNYELYELQRKDTEADEQVQLQRDQEENTKIPSAYPKSALKPTVTEFVPAAPAAPFKDSTNEYNSAFKFDRYSLPAQYDAPKQPIPNHMTKRQRASSRATSGEGDNWSGFDVNSDGGDLDTFSNPSDEERLLQHRLNSRMMSNHALQFGGKENEREQEQEQEQDDEHTLSAPLNALNRKTSLSANAPVFEPGNFTFKSELSLNRSAPPESSLGSLHRTESKESEMPYKRGRPNPSDTSDDWKIPSTIKQEEVEGDVYDVNVSGVKHSDRECESVNASRTNLSLQDVYHKLEQLSINLKARDVVTRDDLKEAIEHDRGLIMEVLFRNSSSGDVLAALKPQIASLKPDEDAIATKLSDFVRPDILSLINMAASDKEKTADIITEHLTNSDIFTSIKTALSDMVSRHSELYDSFHSTQTEIFTNASSLHAKLGDLPDGITAATGALQTATEKLNAYSSLPGELKGMSEYVSDNAALRNDISKAQSHHGKLRTEKDRLLDKLRVAEEERDSAKIEADLSRQSSRKIESDLVKIEATNGSLIESLNGMANKCAQFEHQLEDLFDQKQTWYAADRDYQVRVKELEMQLEMQSRERENKMRAISEEHERIQNHAEELARSLHSSHLENTRLHSEYEDMSRSSLAVNQDLAAKCGLLENRNAELEDVADGARESEEQHLQAHHAASQHVHELEEKGVQDKDLLQEATSTIERLYEEMSATTHEMAHLRRENEGLKGGAGVDVDGRRTPTNKNYKSQDVHAPVPAYNTPVSPAFSSISKLSTSTAATYQADDGWFYPT
ncbi:hypothetical protein E3P81_01775 [Wallemia ichthyophaga]|nr:hypothetical protein E3P97_01774 [Wallemia ichthyophaga]TIB03501.1 hypothetical protein E3P96_01876 [Wallemia ichthyophaga]TIB33247.1 hypothetical protein E3P85_01428 [Wallemia ichthyophaga]TIB47252.1 hypothetical protein E3P82_01774 [Wallemia ichthyophaga]TIB51666.1 hypothetical protein E3P81_01775 [Wallemia ichthyophaga]